MKDMIALARTDEELDAVVRYLKHLQLLVTSAKIGPVTADTYVAQVVAEVQAGENLLGLVTVKIE